MPLQSVQVWGVLRGLGERRGDAVYSKAIAIGVVSCSLNYARDAQQSALFSGHVDHALRCSKATLVNKRGRYRLTVQDVKILHVYGFRLT